MLFSYLEFSVLGYSCNESSWADFDMQLNNFFFRKKLRTLQGKEKKKQNQRGNNSSRNKSSKDRKTFFHDRDSDRKYKADPGAAATMSDMTQLERIAIENSLLMSGSGGGQLYHEQYDEHGVKIEYQCFK